MSNLESGYSLIEIATILVIVSLLLSGALKGQELITGAETRNLISQQNGIKAAYFGFLDRYHALPGDYPAAVGNIKGVIRAGNGNGRIELDNGTDAEYILVWDHLSKAGFIDGRYEYSATITDGNTPKNHYSGYLQLVDDNKYGDPSNATTSVRPNLKTGNHVPVNILAEMDRKIDDGNPYGGTFQFSDYAASGVAPNAADCVDTSGATPQWKVTGEASNCGGASIF